MQAAQEYRQELFSSSWVLELELEAEAESMSNHFHIKESSLRSHAPPLYSDSSLTDKISSSTFHNQTQNRNHNPFRLMTMKKHIMVIIDPKSKMQKEPTLLYKGHRPIHVSYILVFGSFTLVYTPFIVNCQLVLS